MFVADAHSWLWYLADDDRLGEEAEKAFESADRGDEVVFLPSIAVAESIYVTESHGYDIQMGEIVKDLKISSNYRMKSLNHRLIASLVKDDRELSIHDKIIVLTAEQLGAGIISRDKEIESLADEEIIW
jgi:predicted nucleic acid-binding protein